ncbi:MAG TPA: pilus assembly protein PilP [Alcanivoracaceae bacterium]|nr:pilus assembly protein PilP [Alcanivoracaceae bacterium]
MKVLLPVIVLAAATSLVGCSKPDTVELEQTIKEIVERPRGSIEPAPVFVPVANFVYDAHRLRAPFNKPVSATQQGEEEDKEKSKVRPDEERAKEYLESFSLDSLRMQGTISKADASLEALIRDPSGAVVRVKEGSYMGRSHGRVIKVSEAHVELLEIVPDGQDRWVERPRSLTLSE